MNKKITNYRIVARESAEQLESAVEAALGFGWQPHGNLIFDLDAVKSYKQVMVRHDRPTAKENKI
jgi:hypothetical protein